MYKLLIADDEQWIRRRLTDTINWRELGIESVFEAQDGEQALQYACEHAPEVIITDIRMPGLNGLDFINAIKKRGLTPKVIFLSGYSDFDYAQRALKLGAHDYLLKPVDNDELFAIVKKCLAEIENDAQKNKVWRELKARLEQDKPVLKERFLQDLLNGYLDEQALDSGLKYFDIPADGAYSYSCIVIQQDGKTEGGRDAHLLSLGIKDAAVKMYSMIGGCEAVFMQFGEIVFVVFAKAGSGDVTALIEEKSRQVQSLLKELFDVTVTVGVGEACSGILDLTKSFEQAKQAILYRSFLGGNSVYRYGAGVDSVTGIKVSFLPQDAREWLDALKKRDRADIEERVSRLAAELAAQDVRPVDLKSLYIEIITSVINVSHEFERLSQIFPAFNMELFTQLDKIEDERGFRDSLLRVLNLLSAHLQKSAQDNKRKVIQLVIEYIEQHYSEQVSLTDLAGVVYLNPTYLCKIFKLETGLTFTKYIMNYRIKKAIELMADMKLKIYEIAEMVGYGDVQYFTKIFKAIKGMSPTRYRDKIV